MIGSEKKMLRFASEVGEEVAPSAGSKQHWQTRRLPQGIHQALPSPFLFKHSLPSEALGAEIVSFPMSPSGRIIDSIFQRTI